ALMSDALDSLLLRGEEVAQRVPDRVEIVDRVAADREPRGRDLGEQPPGLGREPAGRGRADLDVPAEARVAGKPGQERACLGTVADRVVAVGRIEEIDVVP